MGVRLIRHNEASSHNLQPGKRKVSNWSLSKHLWLSKCGGTSVFWNSSGSYHWKYCLLAFHKSHPDFFPPALASSKVVMVALMNLCRRHIVTDCRPPWWPGRLFGGIAQFENIICSNVSQQLRICWAHLDSNISQQKRPAGKEWKEEKLSGAENGDILFQHNRQKNIKKDLP